MPRVTGECPFCHGPTTGKEPLLLSAEQVAMVIGDVSAAWVRRTVPNKRTLGHSTVRWRAADIFEWIESAGDWVPTE